MKSRLLPALVFLTAGLPSVSQAGTAAEYQALNNWCITYSNSLLGRGGGPSFPPPPKPDHYHHYCSALQALGTLYASRIPLERRTAMVEVENGVRYVISHVPADHYLMPEVYALYGKALYLNKSHASAESNLMKALQLDPAHGPVYATLIHLYLDTKRQSQAEKTVRAGLAHVPDSKSLNRLARQLGVSVKPEPPAKQKEAATTPPTRDAAVPGPMDTGKKADPGKAGAVRAEVAAAATTPPETPTEIGQPGNPWCRFCADTHPTPPHPSPSMPGVVPKAAP